MPYTIFISHTQNDKRIAEAIKRIINDAFHGSIHFFLAVHDLGGGDEWKRILQDRLRDCDAIISLITDHSVNKPWIFIEWSAFWVNNKVFYTLTTEDTKLTNLVDPMRDRQATIITDYDQVRSFFRSLGRDSGHQQGVPYDYIDDFIAAISQAIAIRDQELATLNYARFRDSLLDLPREDAEKRKIARWFYDSGELDTAKKIAAEIRDDLIKCEMATELIHMGDLDNAALIIANIRASDRLASVARALVEHGDIDTPLLKSIIDDIATKNQAELRALCTYLISLGLYDTDLFHYITLAFGNMAELRKVATYFIDNNLTQKPTFDDILEIFVERNVSELRKVLELMIDKQLDRTDPDQFRQGIVMIADKNQKEAEKTLTRLINTNPELVRSYLNENIITNPVSKGRLVQLLNSENPPL